MQCLLGLPDEMILPVADPLRQAGSSISGSDEADLVSHIHLARR